jgi:hypothetical protein
VIVVIREKPRRFVIALAIVLTVCVTFWREARVRSLSRGVPSQRNREEGVAFGLPV